jgi:uncharacterized membrane protein
MKKKKATITTCIFTVLLILWIPFFSYGAVQPQYIHAQVVKIVSEDIDEENFMRYQKIEVQLLEDSYNSKRVIIDHTINDATIFKKIVKQGDQVIVWVEWNESGELTKGYIYDFCRDQYLIYLVGAFFLLLLMIGGSKGLKAIITLILTVFSIVKIFIPLILQGYNPVLVSIEVCIGIIIVSLVIIGGFNRKTLSAIIGTSGGVAIAGAIALVIGNKAHLTGLETDEVEMLAYGLKGALHFDFRGLLFGGIIMGALGAVMDVSMSIASSMYEIEQANPRIKSGELIRAGMNVGRDIMGTMSNTLILAYVGSGINLILVFWVYDLSWIGFVNGDKVASEIIRALAGSIGLIFTIPITAITVGVLRKKYQKQRRNSRY